MIFLQLYIVHISSVSTSRMSRHFSTSGIRLERKFNRGILLLGGRRFVNLTVRVAYSLRVIPWNGINFRGTQWPGSRRISRAKVAAWAVHRETLRQETTDHARHLLIFVRIFHTLDPPGFRNFHREAFTRKIYGESMDRRGWLNVLRQNDGNWAK